MVPMCVSHEIVELQVVLQMRLLYRPVMHKAHEESMKKVVRDAYEMMDFVENYYRSCDMFSSVE
jgi:hypothetical protein